MLKQFVVVLHPFVFHNLKSCQTEFMNFKITQDLLCLNLTMWFLKQLLAFVM